MTIIVSHVDILIKCMIHLLNYIYTFTLLISHGFLSLASFLCLDGHASAVVYQKLAVKGHQWT